MSTGTPTPLPLPSDVPAHVIPLGVPTSWRVAVAAVDYRCQCTGSCGAKHKPQLGESSGPRCPKGLRGRAAVRLFVTPPSPGIPALLVLCAPCLDATHAAERRAAKRTEAARTEPVPSLLDLLTE